MQTELPAGVGANMMLGLAFRLLGLTSITHMSDIYIYISTNFNFPSLLLASIAFCLVST